MCKRYLSLINFCVRDILFFGKLTYVLKENDTKNIMGIPKIYNVNINKANKWLQASHITKQKLRPTRYARDIHPSLMHM